MFQFMAFYSVEDLVSLTGTSKVTIYKQLSNLKEMGLLLQKSSLYLPNYYRSSCVKFKLALDLLFLEESSQSLKTKSVAEREGYSRVEVIASSVLPFEREENVKKGFDSVNKYHITVSEILQIREKLPIDLREVIDYRLEFLKKLYKR